MTDYTAIQKLFDAVEGCCTHVSANTVTEAELAYELLQITLSMQDTIIDQTSATIQETAKSCLKKGFERAKSEALRIANELTCLEEMRKTLLQMEYNEH